MHVAPGALGTTSVALTGGFHPELMKRDVSRRSRGYLDKYFGPAKYHFVLTDRAGVALFDITGANRAMTLRWRVQHGKLTSLFGPPRPWPDSARADVRRHTQGEGVHRRRAGARQRFRDLEHRS